jgi:hypothetical protein
MSCPSAHGATSDMMTLLLHAISADRSRYSVDDQYECECVPADGFGSVSRREPRALAVANTRMGGTGRG